VRQKSFLQNDKNPFSLRILGSGAPTDAYSKEAIEKQGTGQGGIPPAPSHASSPPCFMARPGRNPGKGPDLGKTGSFHSGVRGIYSGIVLR